MGGLLERAAKTYGVPEALALGTSHLTSAVRARHELWALVHGCTGYSLPEMAALFEVDHTTILMALRKRERAFLKRINS